MMTETHEPQQVSYVRKLVIPLIAGGIAGGATSAGIIAALDSAWIGGVGPSEMIAAITGGLYFVIAIGLLIGTLSPALGSKFLNVEDADELREQKSMLLNSTISMGLWGIALVLLALVQPAGPLPQNVVLALAGGTMAIGLVFAWRSFRASDELYAQVNSEATALSYYLIFALAGGWALLAHVGSTEMLAPLDLLTLFYWTGLLAAFVAAGRRGMLKVK